MFRIGSIDYINENYRLVRANERVRPVSEVSKTNNNSESSSNNNSKSNSSKFSNILDKEIKRQKKKK